MKEKLLSIHHFFVGLLLLTKGLDKILQHHSIIGWFILTLGLIVLIYFIAVKFAKRSLHFLEITIHLFESIALFLTTYVYFQEGKAFLPYATLVAAIGFLIVVFMQLRGYKEPPATT